jgi:polyisoprenoid-binding protein YceI
MRGVTRDARMTVSDITGEGKDHNGATKRGASATMKIKRSDFGMTFNKALDAGGVAIADEISLNLDIALVKDGAR